MSEFVTDDLILGGAGFIGSELARRFGSEGTVIFDNLCPTVHERQSIAEAASRPVELIVGDVTDADALGDVIARHRPRRVFHLAAETGTGRSLSHCALNARTNVLGMAVLLDALTARGHRPETIVLTSTRAVYGEGAYRSTENGSTRYPGQRSAVALADGRFDFDGLEPLDSRASDHAPQPVNVYGSTKLCQEHLLSNWCQAHDVRHAIVRLQNVYGAGQSLTNPYTGVLVHFAKQVLAGETVEIYENGGITRDFVHVSDVAALLERLAASEQRRLLLDCGSGERVALEEVARVLHDCAGRPPRLEFTGRFRIGDVRNACANIEQATALLDWRPQVSLAEGLSGLLDFVETRVPGARTDS